MSFTWRATSRIISAAVASSTCDGWRAARQNRRSQSIIISTTGAVTEIIRHLLHIAAEGVLMPRLLLYEFHFAAVIDLDHAEAGTRWLPLIFRQGFEPRWWQLAAMSTSGFIAVPPNRLVVDAVMLGEWVETII
jgi:hypothetical protein